MANSRSKRIPMNDAIQAAIGDFCASRGLVECEWIRQVLCREVGRPELADTMVRGRPKSAKPVEEKPAKKSRQRKGVAS